MKASMINTTRKLRPMPLSGSINPTTSEFRAATPELPRANAIQRLSRNLLLSRLKHLKRGRLTIIDGGETFVFGLDRGLDRGPDGGFDGGDLSSGAEPSARVTIRSPKCYTTILFGGASVGAGEAYMAGYMDVDDLPGLIRLFVANLDVMERMDDGLARLQTPFNRLLHRFRKDTRAGSRRNIAAHYDLGNEFYKLFLDETMTYSCGIFPSPESSLKAASLAKYDRICKKLGLSPESSVLEIGCGWGGFAIHAAQNYGCRVTAATISRRQYDHAVRAVRETGLGDRVEILFRDYRDLTGTFDRLVSIEMIEAVGHHYYDDFFRVCGERLAEDGMALIQAITIRDDRYAASVREPDFIKKYIFPGSCIPSIAAMSAAVARKTDLRFLHLEDITPHYVTTLRWWRERFLENADQVRRLGYPETFIRMWEYYLAYCEGGFAERHIGNVQMLLARPLSRYSPVPEELP